MIMQRNIDISIKTKVKKNEKGSSVTVVAGDSWIKKNDGLALCTKDGLLVVRYFPSANTNGMGLYIKPVRNMSFYNKKYVGSVWYVRNERSH